MLSYTTVQTFVKMHNFKATNNVEDYKRSTHLLGATTLRNVLGTKCLAEILSQRFLKLFVLFGEHVLVQGADSPLDGGHAG